MIWLFLILAASGAFALCRIAFNTDYLLSQLAALTKLRHDLEEIRKELSKINGRTLQ